MSSLPPELAALTSMLACMDVCMELCRQAACNLQSTLVFWTSSAPTPAGLQRPGRGFMAQGCEWTQSLGHPCWKFAL